MRGDNLGVYDNLCGQIYLERGMSEKIQLATTLEQSLKLQELGVPENTADMHYSRTVGATKSVLQGYNKYENCYPAWSLPALFSVIGNVSLTSDGKDTWVCMTSILDSQPQMYQAKGNTAYDAVIGLIEKLVNKSKLITEQLNPWLKWVKLK
jgi:hypothetical protein